MNQPETSLWTQERNTLFSSTLLTLGGIAVAAWTFARIPDVALGFADSRRFVPAEHGPAIWALSLCVAILGLAGLAAELVPACGAFERRHRFATFAMVGLAIALVLWRTWL